ncbi:MAG: hypothetical protein R2800_03845 [Flavipsychrobacter sp.]
MAFFNESLNSQLYVASTTTADKGFAGFLLPQKPSTPEEGYDVDQALTDSSLNGSFILSAHTPQLDTVAETNDFVDKLLNLLGTGRYIIWLLDINDFSATENTIIMTIAGDGSASIQGVEIPLVSNIFLYIQNGIKLTATSDSISLGVSGGSDSSPKIQFTGSDAPSTKITYATEGVLPLSGDYRGCVSFSAFITRSSLADDFSWGFQMLIPLSGNVNQNALAEFLPLASGITPSSDDQIGFDITIDPTDVFNTVFEVENVPGASIEQQYNSRRTVFNFTGKNNNLSETLMDAMYFTVWGDTIQLVPTGTDSTGLQARLLFNCGEQYSANKQKSHLAPEGDFIIQLNGATTDDVYPLQCGLQGTEFFNVRSRTSSSSGDILRFVGNQPAYAPVYPLPQASPVKQPVLPNTPLLDTQYKTSWCTILSGTGNNLPSYVAQPKGSALYGNNGTNSDGDTLIGHVKPSFTFTANDTILFPMLPYTGITFNPVEESSFSVSQVEDFEKTIVAPIRKKAINTVLSAAAKQAKENLRSAKSSTDTASATVTTPSGLIVDLVGGTSNPVWDAINLAQNRTDTSGDFTKMYFDNPDENLVQAFSTSDLFLVIANDKNIGTAVSSLSGSETLDEAAAAFYNNMFIGDWGMQANTGTQNKYNNYNNVIIVKGRKGKLYDPSSADNSLIANWQKWTDKDTFAAPSVVDNKGKVSDPDDTQLVILSQWLQTFFEDAYNQTDTEYFGNFNAIAQDENWTGILIVGMDISALPDNLSGILSGVRDPDAFRTHHFGINITPVEQGANGPQINTPSNMFGLIYYNDPDFVDQTPIVPVEPDLTETYDFILLDLKVLFENTAVKSFQSYAQLTTNNYFGSPVDHMGDGGNSYNTMILTGSLQFKGDEAIYSLATEGVNTFYFNSPVVNKVEITNANFNTVGNNEDGDLVSQFTLNGYWDFKKLTYKKDPEDEDSETVDFDIFSFGSDPGTDSPRKGLIFNNLIIQMTASPYTPGQTDPVTKTMVFDASKITFDQGRSTARPNSLYINFALNLQNYTQGTSDKLPTDKDYLPVITDMKVSSLSGSSWVGLSYQLNMGTPGELAANVGLTSTMLTAWDPAATDDSESAPPVSVGIKLPGTGGGAKLISLQSVLKLSIGQVRLTYVPNSSGDGNSFMMMFTEIALKFLGLLKLPPNGSTLFYLFGNPQSNGKSSGLGWYAMYNHDESTEPKDCSKLSNSLSKNEKQ